MKRLAWLTFGVVCALAVAACSRGDGEVAVDLVEQFDTAREKAPTPETFEVIDATLAGDTRRAIYAKGPSRIVFTTVVPDNGELRVGLGLLEEGWAVAGDGVLFRVLLAAGGPPEEILNLIVNPYGNPNDRSWYDVTLDLSEYAGETVDLYFNTNSSGPGKDDRNGDMAVWGAPRLISR